MYEWKSDFEQHPNREHLLWTPAQAHYTLKVDTFNKVDLPHRGALAPNDFELKALLHELAHEDDARVIVA